MSAQQKAGVDVLDRYVPTGGMGGNVYMECDGFGVSYNASPGFGFSLFSGDGGSDETALCVDGDFYIMNGDFRREYAEQADAGGIDACLRFFASKPELLSSWSSSIDAALARVQGGAA